MSLSQKVYLLGKANVGKTSLFNLLTNSSDKVANYHGATTRLSRKPLTKDPNVFLYDLPGTYSINGTSEDELLTVKTLQASPEGSTWLFVIDGLDFQKEFKEILAFIKKLPQKKIKLLFAINMMDEVEKNKSSLNLMGLKKEVGVSLIPVSAKKEQNLTALSDELINIQNNDPSYTHDFYKTAHSVDLTKYCKQSTNLLLKRTHFIDKVLISPLLGPLFFVVIMTLLFQSVFSWAAPAMDLIESLLLKSSALSTAGVKNLYLKSFIEDALFGGLGAFLVFTPQIFTLSFLIKFLEETGYLARASIITHKVLRAFGLSGESFIPLLTSHACAIPGIYAARHIKSRRVRLLTLLSLPLTVCSAKLPVYTLLLTVLLPNTLYFGGFIGLRGLVLFGLYIFGAFLSLMVGLLLHKALNKKSENLFILELPRYQLPSFKTCLKDAFKTSYDFVKDAGLVIFITNCIIWALATFPNGPGNLKTSFLSQFGKFLAPLSEPIGLNWPETVALITSFLARETFVSTLGTLYGVGSENISSLSEMIQNQFSGSSIPSTLSLIMFFAVALQCVSTLALLKKEIKQKYVTSYLFFGYLILAYVLSFVTYRIGLAFF